MVVLVVSAVHIYKFILTTKAPHVVVVVTFVLSLSRTRREECMLCGPFGLTIE